VTLSEEVTRQLAQFTIIDGAFALPEAAFAEIRQKNRSVAADARWRRAVEYEAVAIRFWREGGPRTGPGIMQLGVLIHDLKAGARVPEAGWAHSGKGASHV
jgi:hypothetical protein